MKNFREEIIWQRLLFSLALIFVLNAVLSILMLTNGCGNYFAFGVLYGDGQECQTWLESRFGVLFFSQSSPLFLFDELVVVLAINWLLSLILQSNKLSKFIMPNKSVFWIVAVVSYVIPLISKEFLPA